MVRVLVCLRSMGKTYGNFEGKFLAAIGGFQGVVNRGELLGIEFHYNNHQ